MKAAAGPAPRAHGFVERDISLNEAARILGHSRNTLRKAWCQIPTAYVSAGGRYYVNPVGLRKWLHMRSSNKDAEAVDASASQAR